MSLFAPAEVTSAYLKMGLMGFQGSGKTRTGTDTAVGLINMMRERGMPLAEKPMFFLDTEKGSDWVKKRIEDAGIKLYTAKTRAFVDLLAAVDEAKRNSSLLLIDSVTHFWVELGTAYAAKQKRNRLYFEDWAYLKGEWRKFTDAFVNSPLHIVLAGRAGFDYDYFENDAGKKELAKTDIKMKAEGEMGYEPDLLVLMERVTNMDTLHVDHVATVMKDRSDMLDGKRFTNPTFKSFLPHIELLNLGGTQLGVDTARTSVGIMPNHGRDNDRIRRKIVLAEIEDLLVLHYPGHAAKDKQAKVTLIREHFNNKSWTEIEELMSLFDLRAGYDTLHRAVEGKPSRYALNAPLVEEDKPEINDSLPGDCAPPTKAVSLKDRLMSDIPTLKTPADCVQWGLAMSDTTEQLSKADQDSIGAALFAHQKRLTLNGHAQRA